MATIQYKQKVRTNKVTSQRRTKKTSGTTPQIYNYYEITIPTDIIKYFESLTGEEITQLTYIVFEDLQYITPYTPEGVDYSRLNPGYTRETRPERAPLLRVRRQGNKDRPRYYIRFRHGVELADFVTFTLNNSIIDVTAPEGVELLGVWEVEGLRLL